MARPPKKSKLTVQYKPLEEGQFDIKPPDTEGRIGQSDPIIKDGSKGAIWQFFWTAFVIFVVFFGIAVYTNGQAFVFETKNSAYAGYDTLKSGLNALAEQDFDKAGLMFEGAEFAFKDVEKNAGFLTMQANNYLKSNLYLDTAEKLIEVGVSVSKIGQGISKLLSDTREIPNIFINQNLNGSSDIKLTDLVNTQKSRLDEIMMETLLIQKNLTNLNLNTLPKGLSESIAKAEDHISRFLSALKEIESNFSTALKLLGDDVPHRYLVLFQNNHELRATGGFIGSYALIDINDGEITKMEVKDVYETDGQLTDIVPPPPGINKVSDRLYMRDANYSPDFPTTAKQIMWFLEHSKGPSVDTVVAIDQTVAEELLKLTGPITPKSFPFVINADNFNDVLSYYIEAKLSTTGTPKQILIDLIPVFKASLLSLKDFSQLNEIAGGLIAGKHIQVYSPDQDIQALAERFMVDGKMVAATDDVDYLSVVSTAIGGNKSDAFIKTNLAHHTEIGHMGEVTDHLIITKNHTWKQEDFAYWKKLIDRYGTGRLSEQTLRFIHGEGDNVDYMRVYVPKGSRLIGLEGVDLEDLQASEDLGYTVFAFTFGPLQAGQSETVKISYKLPYSLDVMKPMDVYRFVAQKQAGSENISLKKSLQTSDHLTVLESYPPTESAFDIYPENTTAFNQNKIFLSAITAK